MSNPAADYENYSVPARFVPLLPSLLAAADPQLGEHVLDVGCGTGIVARAITPLVGSGGQVTGYDLSPDMLRFAQQTAEREGLHITWVEGRAECLPFGDQAFDLVVCQQTLQFIADKLAALREMFRVVHEHGGRLVLNVWQGLDQHPFPARFYSVLGKHLPVAGIDQAYALGDPDVLVGLIEQAGFRSVEIEGLRSTARFRDPDEYLGRQVTSSVVSNPALQHLSAEERRELTAVIHDEMFPVVQEHLEDGELVFDQAVYLLRAIR